MIYTAAIITISDKGAAGLREDTSGPAIRALLEQAGWSVDYTAVIPDEQQQIKDQLRKCADQLNIQLILTSGGTGFSPRDVTPEATLAVIQREARGIPEAMRAASMRITPKACLSRSAAGIRGQSLIVNLPGSEKAAIENLDSVLGALRHGVEILLSAGSADCGQPVAKVLAVCVSEHKGEQKHQLDHVELHEDWGIGNDAHAGKWHRQISLLAAESVAIVQQKIDFPLLPGAFAENILTEGICLHQLPLGTRLRIGVALCEVTQIGKECHQDCAIRQQAGDCVMPREGIFVRVLKGGRVQAGDSITIL